MKPQLTLEEFISRAKSIHEDKYDYSLIQYKNISTNIKVVCPKHGIFETTPENHLKGSGCIKCSLEEGKLVRLTTEDFIERSRKIHGDKYDYTHSEYKNAKTKIRIKCPKHGYFMQLPHHHMRGRGCKKCAMEIVMEGNKKWWKLSRL